MIEEPRQIVDQELILLRRLFDGCKEIHPMFVFSKDGHRTAIPAVFVNEVQKEIVSASIKDLVKRSKPDIVIYVAEAWMATLDKDEKLLDRVSERPDRIEVVIVQIEFETGEKFCCTAKILRTEKDVTLSPFDISTSEKHMGRFMDFFPPKHVN